MTEAERANREFRYPRRRAVRAVLRQLAAAAFAVLTDFQVYGKENLPQGGPLLVVGNHFSFIDPVAMIHATPWPLEFLGGFNNPSAPPIVTLENSETMASEADRRLIWR